MSNIYDVIKRPIITEKGLSLKEQDRTLCFEVADHASKTLIQEAVERIFKVKVQHVRTMVVPVAASIQVTERIGRRRMSPSVRARK
jgi:large subunit ribosomal protein L23